MPRRYGVAHCGHDMHGRQHFDVLVANLQHLPNCDFVKADERMLGAGNAAEVRPDGAVENMRTQGRNRAGQGMQPKGLCQRCGDAVDHQGQGCDVVKVGVGQEHIGDATHLLEG